MSLECSLIDNWSSKVLFLYIFKDLSQELETNLPSFNFDKYLILFVWFWSVLKLLLNEFDW